MEKNKLSVTQQLAYTDAVSYLEALVESFKVGSIVVEQGGEFVTLSPREHVEVTIEAKAKKDKQKFSLELSWNYPPAVETAAVTISAEAPIVTDAPCEITEGCPCGSTESAQSGEESASSEVSATPETPASQVSRTEQFVQENAIEDSGVAGATSAARLSLQSLQIEEAAAIVAPIDMEAHADKYVNDSRGTSAAKKANGTPVTKRPAARKKAGAKKAAGNKAGAKR